MSPSLTRFKSMIQVQPPDRRDSALDYSTKDQTLLETKTGWVKALGRGDVVLLLSTSRSLCLNFNSSLVQH